MSKPKVTECLTEAVPTQENPEWLDVLDVQVNGYRPAILLWREDYDAMRKELEELRAKVIDALEDGYMAGRENKRSLHEVKTEFKKNGKVEWFKCKE